MSLFGRKMNRMWAIAWSHALQYRGDIAIWALVSAVTPLISLAIWWNAFSNGGILSQQEILTYYLVAMFVEYLTRSWRGVFIVQQILDGKIIKYIIRPPFILFDHITNNLTTKALQLSLPLPAAILLVAFFPQFFSAAIYNPANIALFLLSLILAMVLNFCLDFAIGLLAFWLEDAHELHSYRFLFMQVASGILIPFAVMPETVKTLFSFLPFRYIISAPVEILLGQATGAAASQLLLIQAAWVVVLIIILRFEWVRGLKRYAIPGQ